MARASLTIMMDDKVIRKYGDSKNGVKRLLNEYNNMSKIDFYKNHSNVMGDKVRLIFRVTNRDGYKHRSEMVLFENYREGFKEIEEIIEIEKELILVNKRISASYSKKLLFGEASEDIISLINEKRRLEDKMSKKVKIYFENIKE